MKIEEFIIKRDYDSLDCAKYIVNINLMDVTQIEFVKLQMLLFAIYDLKVEWDEIWKDFENSK